MNELYNIFEVISMLKNTPSLIFELDTTVEAEEDDFLQHYFIFAMSGFGGCNFLVQWYVPNVTVRPNGISKKQELTLSEKRMWKISSYDRKYLQKLLDERGIRREIGQEPKEK